MCIDINICAYTYFHLHIHSYMEQCITGQSAIQDKILDSVSGYQAVYQIKDS